MTVPDLIAMGSLAPPLHRQRRSQLAQMIDYTLLRPTATSTDIDKLCDEARRYGFWSVCVNPAFVRQASQRLVGSGTRVCAVVGFPLGATTTEAKVAEAKRAIKDGAEEIDMVSEIGALKAGDDEGFSYDVRSVAAVCHASRATLKVVLECCYLTDDEKWRGARLAEDAGAHFVKTSTGFGPGGATAPDVALLRSALRGGARVKASGGVGTLAKALEMIGAGADRIGTSSGVAILEELPE